MKLKSLVAGAAGMLLSGTAAMAADSVPYYYPATPPAAPAAPMMSYGYDWNGGYFGLGFLAPVAGFAQLGWNWMPNNILFGVEGQFGLGLGGGYVGLDARIGIAVGHEDRVLLYATGGVIKPFGGPFLLAAGPGIEVAFRNAPLSWFGEAQFGLGTLLQTGLNFNFGH